MPKFMKDAPKGTDYGKVQSASVKLSLANDTNDNELKQSAFDELTGLLSTVNKEQYLKKARPLQEFVDAKDTYDYKRKNYTTTKNADKAFSVTTYELQQFLNKGGYTDKFDNPLKEDGIRGAKTSYAYDKFVDATKQTNPKTTNSKYKVEYPLYYPEKHEPKMLDNSKVKLASSDYGVQLLNYNDVNSDKDRLGEGIWSLKNDNYGVEILAHWLYGNGEDIIGYQYLHGTNADVGGFQIKGTISKNSKGDVIYDLSYVWNDKIDPNFIYESDSKKAEFAKSIPFAEPKDYVIRIKWSDKTIIKANPSWYNWNMGWLK